LLGKPILFLSTVEIERCHDAEYVRRQATDVGAPIADMDNLDEVDVAKALRFDQATYGCYIDQYLRCPGADDAPLWNIVSDNIARLSATTRSRQSLHQ